MSTHMETMGKNSGNAGQNRLEMLKKRFPGRYLHIVSIFEGEACNGNDRESPNEFTIKKIHINGVPYSVLSRYWFIRALKESLVKHHEDYFDYESITTPSDREGGDADKTKGTEKSDKTKGTEKKAKKLVLQKKLSGIPSKDIFLLLTGYMLTESGESSKKRSAVFRATDCISLTRYYNDVHRHSQLGMLKDYMRQDQDNKTELKGGMLLDAERHRTLYKVSITIDLHGLLSKDVEDKINLDIFEPEHIQKCLEIILNELKEGFQARTAGIVNNIVPVFFTAVCSNHDRNIADTELSFPKIEVINGQHYIPIIKDFETAYTDSAFVYKENGKILGYIRHNSRVNVTPEQKAMFAYTFDEDADQWQTFLNKVLGIDNQN